MWGRPSPHSKLTWRPTGWLCDLGVQLCDVGVQLCDVVVQLWDVVVQLCDVVVQLCDFGVQLCDLDVKLITHLHVLPPATISGAILPMPHILMWLTANIISFSSIDKNCLNRILLQSACSYTTTTADGLHLSIATVWSIPAVVTIPHWALVCNKWNL
jgi:hypothetical protein